MNRQIRWALLAAVCATLGSALQAQQVYLTTRGPALGGGAPDGVIASSELLQWTANTAGARHHLTESSIATMIGDGNGNGILDDGPARIDALCPTPTGFAGDLTGFLVSFATTVTFGDGTVVTDGDLVSLDPSGTTRVIFSEADLAAATGTTGIDLDAAHLADDGSLVFSFAEDENTSLANLISQNGGVNSLDESTVFRLAAGATEASIFLSKSQLTSMVNQAAGTSLSTIVDTTAICPDPDHPGDWWFAIGSSTSSVEGRVFSTFGGGSFAQIGTEALDSNTFGFGEEEIIEGLATLATAVPSLVLHHPDESGLLPAVAVFDVEGAGPQAMVQLVLANTTFPTPVSTAIPTLGPTVWLSLNLNDPLAGLSFGDPAFLRLTDAQGRARYSFDVTALQPGLRLTLQAFDLTNSLVAPAVSTAN